MCSVQCKLRLMHIHVVIEMRERYQDALVQQAVSKLISLFCLSSRVFQQFLSFHLCPGCMCVLLPNAAQKDHMGGDSTYSETETAGKCANCWNWWLKSERHLNSAQCGRIARTYSYSIRSWSLSFHEHANGFSVALEWLVVCYNIHCEHSVQNLAAFILHLIKRKACNLNFRSSSCQTDCTFCLHCDQSFASA